jgi:hypothetical protein
MSYSIISTHRFEKELKRLAKKFPSLKNEFAELIADITENPKSGTFIGNNCYYNHSTNEFQNLSRALSSCMTVQRDEAGFMNYRIAVSNLHDDFSVTTAIG